MLTYLGIMFMLVLSFGYSIHSLNSGLRVDPFIMSYTHRYPLSRRALSEDARISPVKKRTGSSGKYRLSIMQTFSPTSIIILVNYYDMSVFMKHYTAWASEL